MALSIKSDKADRLARELAAETGESLTEAVIVAIEQRIAQQRRGRADIARRLRSIREEVAELPVLDPRTADEIVGYDQHGLPS